jgi:hypothetical protein
MAVINENPPGRFWTTFLYADPPAVDLGRRIFSLIATKIGLPGHSSW